METCNRWWLFLTFSLKSIARMNKRKKNFRWTSQLSNSGWNVWYIIKRKNLELKSRIPNLWALYIATYLLLRVYCYMLLNMEKSALTQDKIYSFIREYTIHGNFTTKMTSIHDRQSAMLSLESLISKYQKILKENGRYNIAGSKARIPIIDQCKLFAWWDRDVRVNERILSRDPIVKVIWKY